MLARHPPTPEAETCQRIAHEIRAQLAFYHQVGGDITGTSSELGQVALTQADGRVSEATELLRDLQNRIQTNSVELFRRRVEDVETRRKSLVKEGLGADFDEPISRMQNELSAGRRSAALSLLQVVDHQLSRLESDWRGLRSLLKQIDSLRTAAAAIDQDPPGVSESLVRIRELLAKDPLQPEGLDEVAQLAAGALMMLHENLPTSIRDELDRFGLVLAQKPLDEESSAAARSLLADASRFLRKGQLVEAAQGLKKLRAAMKEIAPESLLPPPGRPVPVAALPVEGQAAATVANTGEGVA